MDVDALDSINTVQNSDEREAPATIVEDQIIEIGPAMCTSDRLEADHDQEDRISEFSSITSGGDGGGSCVVVADSENVVNVNNGVINGDNVINSQCRNGDFKHLNSIVDREYHQSLINNSSAASGYSMSARTRDLGGSEILIPTHSSGDFSDIVSDNNQEIIAISDDEEEAEGEPAASHFHDQAFFPGPSSAPPLVPQNYPMNYSSMPPPPPMSMSMPMPPPLKQMYPRSFNRPEPSDVITLSDDDEEDNITTGAVVGGIPLSHKRKRSSRRSPMFHPQICPFCYKPKRENICMSKHLISRHWHRIRAQNMGNSKSSTDYANIKDDREIPVEKYKEDRIRSRSPPLSSYYPSHPPPPQLSGPSTSHMFSRSSLIEQPLRPSFPGRAAFGRPPASSSPQQMMGNSFMGPPGSTIVSGPSPREESKSLSRELAEEIGNNKEMMKSQLSMLIHAHRCDARGSLRKQNSFFQEEKTCSLPDCGQTKELLRHLPTCQAETDCPVKKCFMSKQVIKWALSPDSPGMLKDTRTELHRQAKAGLPPQVIEWATKNKFEKQQWKSWRDTKISGANSVNNLGGIINNTNHEDEKSDPNVENIIVPSNDIPIDKFNQDNISAKDDNKTQPSNSAGNDWKMKYLKAREKMRDNQKAQKMKNGKPPAASLEDKIVAPSSGSVDILSSLLSAQNKTADLRTIRKKEVGTTNKEQGKKVPKLLPPPSMDGGTNGEDAAKYNSLLGL